MDFLKKCFSGLIKAGAMALARHAATLAGSALLTWLLSHHVGADFATRLVGDLKDAMLTATGAALVAAGIGASLKDVKTVSGKLAVTGSESYDAGRAKGQMEGAGVQAAADLGKVQAVSEAMKAADTATKQDRASVVAALKSGTF